MTRTVLVYGDSNSHGSAPLPSLQERRRHARGARWPDVMAAALGPDWRVIDEALPSRTTVHPDPVAGVHRNGLAVLPAVLESHAPLDLVILMLGTNDLKARFALPPVEIAMGVEQLVRHIRQDVTGRHDAAPVLLLVCPPPVDEAGCLAEIFAGAAAKSRRLPPLYAEVAARWGAAFFDAGTVIAPSPVDGVHFDVQDHRTLGEAIAREITALI